MYCFCGDLKICYNPPKAPAAQRRPKRVGVNWITQSISIKDFKALIPPVCSGNWNQLQKAPPVGLLQIIAGRYQQWVEDVGSWKISESIWVRDSVDELHMCMVMPCTHLPAAALRLRLDLVFAASAVEENQSSEC